MTIQIDSREKQRAVRNIVRYFDERGIKHFSSKLYVGDYMNYDNPRVIVDRKQNLQELCGNVCQQHERFRSEIVRAGEAGVHLVFLCEHSGAVRTLDDVLFWENPRRRQRIETPEGWRTVETNAATGETLFRILSTIQRKYGVEFLFCSKRETGRRIVELLS